MRKELKERAITLRKEGKTYREILAEIPVAKSTLSEWLKSVGLSVPQQQRITQKRIAAAMRGAQSKRNTRLREIDTCISNGIKDIGILTVRELWLIGTALYWAEGSKQKARSVSSRLIFINSDPRMIRVYLAWLRLLGVPRSQIRFCLYIHVDRKTDAESFRTWWTSQINASVIPRENVYFKKGNIKTNRTNIDDLYHGILRITVKSSTFLNRKVEGWIEGIGVSSVPE